jgi:hypothetical protein
MPRHLIAVSAAACLIVAGVAFADEPECATNYRVEGKAAQTFVSTRLDPQSVIERLPRKLIAAGVTMKTSEPEKGMLQAAGLDVKAEVSGNVTRVTFLSSANSDKTTLCRYASLVGNPPLPQKAPVSQDPTLVAKLKDDLVRKHQLVQMDAGRGLNKADIDSEDVFLKFEIESVTQPADNKVQYDISMLLPAAACGIAKEDSLLLANGFAGRDTPPRTKPARVDATMIYTKSGNVTHLTDAFITKIETVK